MTNEFTFSTALSVLPVQDDYNDYKRLFVNQFGREEVLQNNKQLLTKWLTYHSLYDETLFESLYKLFESLYKGNAGKSWLEMYIIKFKRGPEFDLTEFINSITLDQPLPELLKFDTKLLTYPEIYNVRYQLVYRWVLYEYNLTDTPQLQKLFRLCYEKFDDYGWENVVSNMEDFLTIFDC